MRKKKLRISRRKFLAIAFASLPVFTAADGFLLEPKWLAVRRIDVNDRAASRRLVHFSDLHYKGDRAYLTETVRKINKLSPQFACFTGDIVEKAVYLPEALELLGGIDCPLFGVPGNHDYWSGASFPEIAACFENSGGAWLVDQEAVTPDGEILIIGSTGSDAGLLDASNGRKRILLTHFPAFVDELAGTAFDLILAGHSHGGQVRIPFLGAPILPYRVGRYDRGLFQTPAGPLYVNPGIGTFHIPVRFLCRPEITLIKL